MSVLKPKSKMISIRLSDEEYEGLRTLCVSRGARSVSDLAREAMNETGITLEEAGQGMIRGFGDALVRLKEEPIRRYVYAIPDLPQFKEFISSVYFQRKFHQRESYINLDT